MIKTRTPYVKPKFRVIGYDEMNVRVEIVYRRLCAARTLAASLERCKIYNFYTGEVLYDQMTI
jgi:hypothetical protein